MNKITIFLKDKKTSEDNQFQGVLKSYFERKELIYENKDIDYKETNQIRTKYCFIVREESEVNIIEDMIFTSSNTNKQGRNTAIGQAFSPFVETLESFKFISSKCRLYFYDFNEFSANVVKFDFSCIEFLFLNGFSFKNISFSGNPNWKLRGYRDNEYNSISNITSFIEEKDKLSKRNQGNQGTYFELIDSDLFFTANLSPANFGSTILYFFVISKLYKSVVEVDYFANRHTTFELWKKFKNIISEISNNIEFIEELENVELIKEDNFEKLNEELKRRTYIYHRNLYDKFGPKKCFLCSWDVPDLIVGSHIKRFADIKNDPSLNDEQKREEVIDRDNGFWLCVLHDKLFENGFIYVDVNNDRFELSEKKIAEFSNIDLLEKKIYLTMSSSWNKEISKQYMTDKTREYCIAHFKRTQI